MNNHNNNNNNNINNMNNNNEYNIKLYNSVFNNKYLKTIILNHLTIYNILFDSINFQSHEQFEQFKFKEYLNNVTLDYEYEDLDQLPENIKHIQIGTMNKSYIINKIKSLPNHIESIESFITFSSKDIKSEFSTLNPVLLSKVIGFNIEIMNNGDQVELNKLFPSVTDLCIYSQKKIELKKEMFPSKIKRIRLSNVMSIENGCLLESLSDVCLFYCSPSIINKISSINLVKLTLTLDSEIINFNNSIKFPESLQELSIECNYFSSKLPSNLKSLSLTANRLDDTIVFPSSLEHIRVLIRYKKNEKEVFNNKESIPHNLKSLEIVCSSIVDDNNGESILPDNLEKLTLISYFDIYFNQVFQVNQLPSSLTYLNLGFVYNQVIEVNVLPPCLKRLILEDGYTQIINPLAIPQQLELLEILNRFYDHPINLSESTHPNILINCNNLDLYYDPTYTSLRKLRLPEAFNSPLSTLQLQDKSSLEYLYLGCSFDKTIELSDLPDSNNIKTLELGSGFNQTINLEYFQNLEKIILPQYSNATITTTTITNQQDIIYNHYNLKNIIVPPNNSQFIINLDRNFYQFIIIKKIE